MEAALKKLGPNAPSQYPLDSALWAQEREWRIKQCYFRYFRYHLRVEDDNILNNAINHTSIEDIKIFFEGLDAEF